MSKINEISGNKTLLRKVTKTFQNNENKKKKYIPHSLLHTKLELPILYSNLVIIEDMKIENSKYFINANGFLSNSIKVHII